MREWLRENGPVDNEDLERHDKWLCMMWPRLHLLRELLADDGVIFVSIDDNEQHHLRAVMDEVFGGDNFVTNVVWERKYGRQNDARWFSASHDFVTCYAFDKLSWRPTLLPRTEKQNASYTNVDSDPRGAWKSGDFSVKGYRQENDYPITTPSGRIVNPPNGRSWIASRERLQELIADDRIWFGEDGNSVPSPKIFLSEVKDGVTPVTVWRYDDVGHTQSGTQGLRDIGVAFPNPKPHTLIQRILHIAGNKNAIILDSFAGSGTTAHATLALNREDGGNRRFILVECEEYADTITAERVRRVIDGVPNAKDQALRDGLGGSFTYCRLGEPIDAEGLLRGERLPDYETLAAYLLHTAAGAAVDPSALRVSRNDGRFYRGGTTDYYLFYEPDLERLRGDAAMLTDERARQIAAACRAEGRQAIVFGAGKYLGQRELTDMRITFSQLPYELFARG